MSYPPTPGPDVPPAYSNKGIDQLSFSSECPRFRQRAWQRRKNPSRVAAFAAKNAAQSNRSASPYQQRTTQTENPTQQLIKQAVDYLIEQLNAGHSDMLAAYLRTMARFHNYSFGKILQIARQRPAATHVAGFGKWKELGRFVKKGEKGILMERT